MSGLLLRFAPTTSAASLAETLRETWSTYPWWNDAPKVGDDGSGELSVMRGDGSADPLDDAFMAFTDIDAVVRTLESQGAIDWTVELEGSPPAQIVQGKRDARLRDLIAMGIGATFTSEEGVAARIERIRAEE